MGKCEVLRLCSIMCPLARGAEAQGDRRTCPRAPKLTGDRPRSGQGTLSAFWSTCRAGFWQARRWGRAGDASPTLGHLKIFRSVSFFCFLTVVPDLPLPPEDLTAAASSYPPAGPAGVHSTASVGGHEAAQGAVGLGNSPKPSRAPPPGTTLLEVDRGELSLCVSISLQARNRGRVPISSPKES